MFKRPSLRYGKTPQPETPYQRAAQVWDDRIGSARVQARNWRLACFFAMGLAILLAGGLLWQNARGAVVPWVVEVDKLGEARAVAPAEAGATPRDSQIAYHLARFIERVRNVPDDPVVLRRSWLRAYDFVSEKGALALNEHARASDPFAVVGRQQVSVEVTSVIRASPSSFRIAWIEREYRDGSLSETSRWTAILGVALRQPRTSQALVRNPLGIFVTSIHWSKEFG
jgi:type IV secretion system protein VirB5